MNPGEITATVRMYKCSNCMYVSSVRCLIVHHTNNARVCEGEDVVDAIGTVVFPNPPVEKATSPVTRGQRRWDPVVFFKGRIAAFSDEAFDTRLEYLFDTEGLVDQLIGRHQVDDILSLPMKVYEALWGKDAPLEFQSIVAKCNSYAFVESVDIEGEVWPDSETMPVFERRTTEELFEFLRTLFSISIPLRRPDLEDHCRALATRLLDHRDGGMTYIDYITKSSAYRMNRKYRQPTSIPEEAKIILQNISSVMKNVKADMYPSGEITVRIYKCTKCTFTTSEHSGIKLHLEKTKRCVGAKILEGDASFTFPESAAPVRYRIPTGPTPWDAVAEFRGRIPAFDADALAQRLEYLFENPTLLDTILDLPGTEGVRISFSCGIRIMRLLYKRLWGRYAPEKFQSIVARSITYVYVDSVTEFGDPNVMVGRKNEFERRAMAELFDFARVVFRDHIPTRRPELKELAESFIYKFLDYNVEGVSYTDYITKNERFQQRKDLLKGGMQFKRDAERIKRALSDAFRGIRSARYS